jgi:hypothetical protein
VIDRSKCALIAVAAMLAVTSSAFAQPAVHRTRGTVATSSRSSLAVDRNDPALAGGGSLGYNQAVERGI